MISSLIALMWLPVLISAVVAFLVGFLWYGPLFGKKWMELSQITITTPPPQSDMIRRMVIHFVTNICTSIALFLFVLIPNSFEITMYLTLVAFVGFFIPQQVSAYLWSGRSLKLVCFDLAACLVSLVLTVTTLFFVVKR